MPGRYALYALFDSELAGFLPALEGRLTLFGGLSSVAATMALTYGAARRLRARLKKRGFEAFGVIRRWTRFLRAHHAAFGWMALATATAHALYFVSASPNLSARAITGWASLGALVVLVAAGVCLSQASRTGGKSKKARGAYILRRTHITLAGLFVVALSVHAGFPVVILGLWALLALPTALVWRRRKSRHNIKE
jgi:hypothetical protein